MAPPSRLVKPTTIGSPVAGVPAAAVVSVLPPAVVLGLAALSFLSSPHAAAVSATTRARIPTRDRLRENTSISPLCPQFTEDASAPISWLVHHCASRTSVLVAAKIRALWVIYGKRAIT